MWILTLRPPSPAISLGDSSMVFLLPGLLARFPETALPSYPISLSAIRLVTACNSVPSRNKACVVEICHAKFYKGRFGVYADWAMRLLSKGTFLYIHDRDICCMKNRLSGRWQNIPGNYG